MINGRRNAAEAEQADHQKAGKELKVAHMRLWHRLLLGHSGLSRIVTTDSAKRRESVPAGFLSFEKDLARGKGGH
jgi:hypothetical protein